MREIGLPDNLKRPISKINKHLGYEELLQLKDKDVKPVEDIRGEFGEHEKEQVEVD